MLREGAATKFRNWSIGSYHFFVVLQITNNYDEAI